MLGFNSDLVSGDAVFSAGQHAEISFDKSIVERIVIHHRGIVRAVRNRAVGAGCVAVHNRLVAYIAHLDSGIQLFHRLVKLDKVKITVYDINVVLIIYFHLSVSQLLIGYTFQNTHLLYALAVELSTTLKACQAASLQKSFKISSKYLLTTETVCAIIHYIKPLKRR